ncbi:MAG: glycosyltransferase family 39 protein [Xanthobacteraceae bacterium]|nr:glycosyltransferase family 39 protein [Xanthobacteraceae bacterium]
MTVLTNKPQRLSERTIALAQRDPGRALRWILSFHLLVWSALPLLVCSNLQLDLVEHLALGKEWQLGYWKHPPFPWWTADLAFRIAGEPRVVYVLGPIASLGALYAVWRLAFETVGPQKALIAVLPLEGLHFFNISAVKFNHDVMLLPFWTFAGYLLFRALTRDRWMDWVLTGAVLALGFWTKYTILTLVAVVGLFFLYDPIARQKLKTAGPYLAALSFFLISAPHVWWLVSHSFLPFQHVLTRAQEAKHWYDYIAFPARWIVGQAFFLLPTVGLLSLVVARPKREHQENTAESFARRYVFMLAVGPFALTTLASAVLGRLPVAMWGYPLWSFAPLAALMYFSPAFDRRRMVLFARAFATTFVAFPLAFAVDELFESFVRDRAKATEFPGRQLAEVITRQWHERFGTPLLYVGGADFGSSGVGEFPANNVAVYSSNRPHVIVHGDPQLSPWIDVADVKRRGAVFVWQQHPLPDAVASALKANFPAVEFQTPLTLPRQTLYPRKPAVVGYAVLAPNPGYGNDAHPR